jgi:hypothetical protein
MSGRRSHSRFSMANPWSGAITLLSDVVVNRTEVHELVIISKSPGVRDEELALDVYGAGEKISLKVRVLDSRPVIIDGTVRHRVRLSLPAMQREVPVERPQSAEPVAFEPIALRVAEAG